MKLTSLSLDRSSLTVCRYRIVSGYGTVCAFTVHTGGVL